MIWHVCLAYAPLFWVEIYRIWMFFYAGVSIYLKYSTWAFIADWFLTDVLLWEYLSIFVNAICISNSYLSTSLMSSISSCCSKILIVFSLRLDNIFSFVLISSVIDFSSATSCYNSFVGRLFTVVSGSYPRTQIHLICTDFVSFISFWGFAQ